MGRIFPFQRATIALWGGTRKNTSGVNGPPVSRRHAQLSFQASGWVWQNSGQAPTFLAGQPVAQFALGQQVDVCLASPQGPALHLATAASHGQGATARTSATELAARVEGGVAGQTHDAGQPPPHPP